MKRAIVLEHSDKDDFERELNELLNKGYVISSSYCGISYRAIMIDLEPKLLKELRYALGKKEFGQST